MPGFFPFLPRDEPRAFRGSAPHQGSAPGLGESLGLGEGEGEGLGDGEGLGEGDGDGDGEREGLGEGFGVGFGLDTLALGETEGGSGGGGGWGAISRPKVTGRITLGAWDELGLADEGEGARISETGDGEAAWMAADGANEGGESAKSPSPFAAWE
jgi:hypothetical protein